MPGVRGPDRLVDELGRTFDAAVAREDSMAATDLALSLRQGIPLRDALKGRISLDVITARGVSLPVRVVREDHVAAGEHGDLLIPLEQAVFVRMPAGNPADAPTHEPLKLFAVLRPHARAGAYVQISTDSRDFTGHLVAATPDHLVLKDRARDILVPLGAIRAVRLSRGGSEGAF